MLLKTRSPHSTYQVSCLIKASSAVSLASPDQAGMPSMELGEQHH